MNRKEFMKRLEKLLYDISPSERENAIEYYNDYFEDAGEENEASIIRELGSPEKVAKTIKDGLYPNDDQECTYTETGYQENGDKSQERAMPGTRPGTPPPTETQRVQQEQKTNWSKIILIGILAVLFIPAIGAAFGVLAGIFGVLVGVIATVFAVVVSLFVLAIALWICGIALIVAAFATLFTPGDALLLAGAGLIVMAVGCLTLILAVWSCNIFPATIRGIVKLFNIIFRKRGA